MVKGEALSNKAPTSHGSSDASPQEAKPLLCQTYGESVQVADDLSCLHPKEVCKFRLNCPIHAIGLNR